MTDLSRIIDYSGSTIVCNDVITGTGTTGGLEAVTGTVPSLNTLTTTNADQLRFTIKGINCNVATNDNAVTITLPTGTTTYNVAGAYLWGASGNTALNAATMSLYSAAGGTGTAIAADQAMVATSGTADTLLNMSTLTLAAAAQNTSFTTAKTLYFRTGTKTNATVTTNATVIINILG